VEQIVAVLKEAELGTPVAELIRHGTPRYSGHVSYVSSNRSAARRWAPCDWGRAG